MTNYFGQYSLDEIRLCVGFKATTYSGADVIIKGIHDNLVYCEYRDSVDNVMGFGHIGHRSISVIPRFELFKDTKLGKLILL